MTEEALPLPEEAVHGDAVDVEETQAVGGREFSWKLHTTVDYQERDGLVIEGMLGQVAESLKTWGVDTDTLFELEVKDGSFEEVEEDNPHFRFLAKCGKQADRVDFVDKVRLKVPYLMIDGDKIVAGIIEVSVSFGKAVKDPHIFLDEMFAAYDFGLQIQYSDMPAVYGEEERLYSGTLGGERYYWWPGSYKEPGQPSWEKRVQEMQSKWLSAEKKLGEVGEGGGGENKYGPKDNAGGEGFAK